MKLQLNAPPSFYCFFQLAKVCCTYRTLIAERAKRRCGGTRINQQLRPILPVLLNDTKKIFTAPDPLPPSLPKRLRPTLPGLSKRPKDTLQHAHLPVSTVWGRQQLPPIPTGGVMHAALQRCLHCFQRGALEPPHDNNDRTQTR